MKLAANLNLLYGSMPEAERFAAAARDGFAGVEVLFPYEQSPQWYVAQLRAHRLQLVLINTPVYPGSGRMGLAAIAGMEQDFRGAFERALGVARVTACPTLHVMAGLVSRDRHPQARATLLDNLRWAAEEARRAGVVLTLEALNRTDMPAYAYHQPREALEVVRALDTAQVRLQFDLYHAAKEGLDLVSELEHALPYVRHVQIAGAPDRHEPDLSQDKLLDCFELLARRGYTGWIGCEYRPRHSTGVGLVWRDRLLERGWIE